MNFTFIITNLSGGGAEKVVLTLAAALKGRAHTVTLILLENKIQYDIPDGLEISILKNKLSRGFLGKYRMARLLKRKISSNPLPDLIISALPFANEVAILANLHNHWCRIDNSLSKEIDILSQSNPRKSSRRLKRYQNLYNKRPLIALSDEMISDLRNRMSIKGRIEKITNPFDIPLIRQLSQEPCPDIPDTSFAIHVGRFNKQKRHDVLLDAWLEAKPGIPLLLLTPHHPALQQMIETRGLSDTVKIVGFQKNPYPWIANASLLILSSDYEGHPGVLIESLICNTPAVSTDCPFGPREILGQFPDCLVQPNDPADLSKAIIQCLAKPPDVSQTDLSKYQINTVAEQYEHLGRMTLNQ